MRRTLDGGFQHYYFAGGQLPMRMEIPWCHLDKGGRRGQIGVLRTYLVDNRLNLVGTSSNVT